MLNWFDSGADSAVDSEFLDFLFTRLPGCFLITLGIAVSNSDSSLALNLIGLKEQILKTDWLISFYNFFFLEFDNFDFVFRNDFQFCFDALLKLGIGNPKKKLFSRNIFFDLPLPTITRVWNLTEKIRPNIDAFWIKLRALFSIWKILIWKKLWKRFVTNIFSHFSTNLLQVRRKKNS